MFSLSSEFYFWLILFFTNCKSNQFQLNFPQNGLLLSFHCIQSRFKNQYINQISKSTIRNPISPAFLSCEIDLAIRNIILGHGDSTITSAANAKRSK